MPSVPASGYFDALRVGGYPAVRRLGARSRERWFEQYVETVLRREIELADDIRRTDALAGLVRYSAVTTAQELVIATAAERLALDVCRLTAGRNAENDVDEVLASRRTKCESVVGRNVG